MTLPGRGAAPAAASTPPTGRSSTAPRSPCGGAPPAARPAAAPPAAPADRAQLDRSPVSLRRVAALFRPYARPLAVVVAIIVASSAIALVSPFLLREVI